MSRFDFLTRYVIDENDIEEVGERVFYLDRTIAQSTINILYAPAGTGKTWMSFALSGALMDCGLEVIYLDNDNGIHLLKDRGWDRFLNRYAGRMHYVNADMLDDAESDMKKIMHDLKANAEGSFYRNVAVVYDSLQFFLNGGMYDENKIRNFNAMCKRIRKSGGTVIVLNHSTKNGLTMKGGGSLIDSADEVWHLRAVHSDLNEKHFIMTPEKKRNGTEEAGYTIDIKTMKMTPLDPIVASMGDEEREFVKKILELINNEELAQGVLLKSVGSHGADKTRIGWLEKHEGRCWSSAKKGKLRLYKKISTGVTDVQT
ncbi:MAG: AAA family ATPase [Sulfuricurvum sp.]|jgi:hypothetical protein|uniref:AAA family ATPase n=1 Tax=Sulfuricurvum sp. TaxID=2025608 RepID=UPI0025F276E7|nr:AAA family ATPase [Sulfuricurvum sp.]MCK9372594.1 AAA family ATPase [Sulfuricurvum sp.]